MKTISVRSPLLIASLLFTSISSAFSQQVTRISATDKMIAGSPAQQFTIGAEDGEDWELLSRVSGVAFDGQDNLYVLDAGNSRVLVFDAKGRFVRKIGKKGGGPGELLSPVGLALTRDGYVAIADIGRPGVSLFKIDGGFVKNLVMGDTLGMPAPLNGTLAHPGGGVVVRGMPMFGGQIRGGNVSGVGAAGQRRSPITWLAANGNARKLFALEMPNLNPRITDSGGGSGQRNVSVRVSMPAFQPPTLWAVLPSGNIVVADEADYRIKIISNDKVNRVIERSFAPRKVTEHDKDKARELRRRNMKTGTGMIIATNSQGPGGSQSHISTGGSGAQRIPDADIEEMVRQMTFLDQVPALQRLIVDPKGRLWIERTGKEVGDRGPIDIIDGAGAYVGTVNGKLPDAISASGRAAYMEKDEMDVEHVVVRSLPASWK